MIAVIEWNYCSDRLPEENGEYLVSVIPYEHTEVLEFADGGWRYWESSADDYYYKSGVYAWAPIPEAAPYKKEEF